MSDTSINNFNDAASIIKDAIIRSRYQAATLVNRELLSLYYAVGQYVSQNSRGQWGNNAIKQISDILQKELPGLRGFSESAIKKMRLFYEEWQTVFANRSLLTNDFAHGENRSLPMNDLATGLLIDLSLLETQITACGLSDVLPTAFYKLGFTHHYTILGIVE